MSTVGIPEVPTAISFNPLLCSAMFSTLSSIVLYVLSSYARVWGTFYAWVVPCYHLRPWGLYGLVPEEALHCMRHMKSRSPLCTPRSSKISFSSFSILRNNSALLISSITHIFVVPLFRCVRDIHPCGSSPYSVHVYAWLLPVYRHPREFSLGMCRASTAVGPRGACSSSREPK